MLKIKLIQFGRIHDRTFRIAVQTGREKMSGRVVELLGYVGGKNKENIKIDRLKAAEWIKKGAIPTPTVAKMLELPVADKNNTVKKISKKASKTK